MPTLGALSAAADHAASALLASTPRPTARTASSTTFPTTACWSTAITTGSAAQPAGRRRARHQGQAIWCKVYNDRGAVICAASLTERLAPRRRAWLRIVGELRSDGRAGPQRRSRRRVSTSCRPNGRSQSAQHSMASSNCPGRDRAMGWQDRLLHGRSQARRPAKPAPAPAH